MSALRNPVLVVGAGIAGLTAAHELRKTGAAVTLVDAAPRLGGKIWTEHQDGFLVEAGPDSFITRKPEALELVEELGLTDRLLGTRSEHRRVYVLCRGALVPLPEGMTLLVPTRLGSVLTSPLLSWRGKLRLALDLVIPPRRDPRDESLADFVRRRFGGEVLERVAGPLLAGIHSGNPERLSLLATFPNFAEMERRHGSLIRAVRRTRPARLPSPTSVRMSFRGGMAELVEALATRLTSGPRPVDLRPARRITSLRPEPETPSQTEGWVATLDDGTRLATRAVVLAVPAAAAAELLASTDTRLAAGLRELTTSPSAAVTLGFRSEDVPHRLDGFGFVVPAAEGRSITACTWSSVKFEHRAPAGHALLRVFVGGPRETHLAGLDDETMAVLARDELRELLGITAPPVLTRVHRAWGGNPQYEVGHGGRVAELEAACPPGLLLAGSAYHGVGLPACIASGRRAAERVAARLAATFPQPAGVG